ncbi:uncharacterized protein [Prorops nasuta]|uniref:uncharacterized protein n=1 Tax=Prorops nasuta TaxID=863751 RepID=UPI0034CEAEBB
MSQFVPIIWVLLSNKLERTYVEIFEFIKAKIIKRLEPLHCICDFEIGLHNAIRAVFHSCHITGCYFHFVQSLTKKARRYQIFEKTKNRNQLHIKTIVLFRKICNLALLPAHFIQQEFDIIVNRTAEEPILFQYFEHFFKYFKNYWLKRIGVQIFSIYRLKDSTNNCQERYHETLNEKMNSHPALSNFVGKYKQAHNVQAKNRVKVRLSQLIRISYIIIDIHEIKVFNFGKID